MFEARRNKQYHTHLGYLGADMVIDQFARFRSWSCDRSRLTPEVRAAMDFAHDNLPAITKRYREETKLLRFGMSASQRRYDMVAYIADALNALQD